MDSIVHGVAKSQTQLNNFHFIRFSDVAKNQNLLVNCPWVVLIGIQPSEIFHQQQGEHGCKWQRSQ